MTREAHPRATILDIGLHPIAAKGLQIFRTQFRWKAASQGPCLVFLGSHMDHTDQNGPEACIRVSWQCDVQHGSRLKLPGDQESDAAGTDISDLGLPFSNFTSRRRSVGRLRVAGKPNPSTIVLESRLETMTAE